MSPATGKPPPARCARHLPRMRGRITTAVFLPHVTWGRGTMRSMVVGALPIGTRPNSPRLPVQEHVAGAVDLGGEVVGAAVVGVQLHHQTVVRLLDRGGVGAGGEAEDRVGLLDGDVGAGGGAPAAVFAADIVAPIRVATVEIGFEEAGTVLVRRTAFAQ